MDVYSVVLEYPPAGVNHMYARGRKGVYMTPDMQAWKWRQQLALNALSADAMIASGLAEVVIDVYRPSVRGDVDGRVKSVLDCLQGHAYTDDAQVKRITITNHVDRKQPRIEVAWWKYKED